MPAFFSDCRCACRNPLPARDYPHVFVAQRAVFRFLPPLVITTHRYRYSLTRHARGRQMIFTVRRFFGITWAPRSGGRCVPRGWFILNPCHHALFGTPWVNIGLRLALYACLFKIPVKRSKERRYIEEEKRWRERIKWQRVRRSRVVGWDLRCCL